MTIADESAEYARRAARSNISDHQLDEFDSAVGHIAFDLLAGPVIPPVLEARQVRDDVFAALEGHRHPRQGRRLHAVVARVCGLLAGATADRFGLYEAASRHARIASQSADLAEDPTLIAWTASVRSTIAFWQGRYRTAAMIAQEARATAPNGVETARLASLEARGWAKLGDQDAMTLALESAASARDGAGPCAGPGVMAYPVANQVRVAATAYLWIGDYAKARGRLAEAIRLLESEYDSLAHIAAARSDLALADLETGALDDAAESLRPLLSSPSDSYLVGAVRRTPALIRILSGRRYSHSHVARQLVADIESFVAYQASNAASIDVVDESGGDLSR